MAIPMSSGNQPEARTAPGLSPQRRIYTNRNLRMSSIEAIGFDMDHTLAVYNTDTFSRLCFDLALVHLVNRKRYPAAIQDIGYEPDLAIRGLTVDKRLGNLVKVDGYNYVSRVRHGGHLLPREERREMYKRGRIRVGSERYRVFDTLFDLPEGCIYSALVKLKDSSPELLRDTSYRVLFNDIREAVDTIHRDGTLKRRIIADLDRYFIKDLRLAPTLHKFRQAGKRLFLLTNSEADYTAAVMNYLLGPENEPWEEIFDLVICSARKPGFFHERSRRQTISRGQDPLLANQRGNCFIGGDAFFLESKIKAFGDAILYFGDHTYGDILRSKLSVGWRTAMIIPELEEEVAALQHLRPQVQQLAELEAELEDLVLERDQLLVQQPSASQRLRKLETAISTCLGRRSVQQRKMSAAYNQYWGSLFKEGRAASRFGSQVQEFACIYTSRVSNFLYYPVAKFFAKPAEVLPHEEWLLPAEL
ncbi:MAG: HAD-IG family 5'-nucleotidase [bacterium]